MAARHTIHACIVHEEKRVHSRQSTVDSCQQNLVFGIWYLDGGRSCAEFCPSTEYQIPGNSLSCELRRAVLGVGHDSLEKVVGLQEGGVP
jgi:hypothetical protein